MKLKSVSMKDFKRFTDLTVKGIPETARLIILAGPNGCGKSSFFDALISWYKLYTIGNLSRGDYYAKSPQVSQKSPEEETPQVSFHDHHAVSQTAENQEKNKKTFYIRSAYRNQPEFQISQLRHAPDLLDGQRVNRMIDSSVLAEDNYQRLAGEMFEDAYERSDASMELGELREQAIGGIRVPIEKLFDGLKLNGLANPLRDGTFRFTKGQSKGFAYKNLSGGEKAAFDLILDLVIVLQTYNNTVFCIDEPEAHMNTRLQAELLSALYGLIPENCQLILATHSIGMMRRARDIENENHGSVVFLDFGGYDFDKQVEITPTTPNRAFWERVYEVALDDLATLVAPSQVIICEGCPKTKHPVKNHSTDAKCYNAIFGDDVPETRFVSMGGASEVSEDKWALAETLRLLVGGLDVVRLIDRDDCSDEEVTALKRRGIKVLARRNLESYMFDDEVLSALAASVHRADKVNELLEKKKRIRKAQTGSPSNDLKPASGEIYNACKSILGLTQRGSNATAFMRDTLAPLIKPGMAVYDDLHRDIFDSPPNTTQAKSGTPV